MIIKTKMESEKVGLSEKQLKKMAHDSIGMPIFNDGKVVGKILAAWVDDRGDMIQESEINLDCLTDKELKELLSKTKREIEYRREASGYHE